MLAPGPEGDRQCTMAALIGMVDHPGRASLPQRHVECVQHELSAQVVRHGPADHAATPGVDHDRQVQEPGPGRHVRDVRYPELVASLRGEVAVHEIRGGSGVSISLRRPRTPSTRDPFDPGSAHESRDALATDSHAVGRELGVDAWDPVGPPRALVDLDDPVLQRLVRTRSRRRLPCAPRVVPAGGDAQQPAHALDRILCPVFAHKPERPRGVEPVS